jgi:predicted RNase H-like HicB family nuclease
MAARLSFKVNFEPDGDGWHASIPRVPGCLTWGRSLSEARRNLREALATCVDVFKDADRIARDAEFIENMQLPAAAKRALGRYSKARARLSEQVVQTQAAAREATLRLLGEAGVSLRDAGELLGLSRERVRQLAG